MLIMEKKEYIIEARPLEILGGQSLTDGNVDNFSEKLIDYFSVYISPYKCTVSSYHKNDKGHYVFYVVTWEDSKK